MIFRDYFIPHHGNAHFPKAIRPKNLLALLALTISLQFVYNIQHSGQFRVLAYATDVRQQDVIADTNAERLKAGEVSLIESTTLDRVARAKAEHMSENDYWSHIAPDGTTPWYFFEQEGYTYLYAGENLARGFNTSAGVVEGWMNSPGHKRNMLSVNYTEVGVAVKDVVLGGEQTTLVVAVYGQPVDTSITIGGDSQNTNEIVHPELAPVTKKAVLAVGSMGWASLFSAGALTSLTPVYLMTHLREWRKRRNQRKYHRTKLVLETTSVLFVIAAILSSAGGIVG